MVDSGRQEEEGRTDSMAEAEMMKQVDYGQSASPRLGKKGE